MRKRVSCVAASVFLINFFVSNHLTHLSVNIDFSSSSFGLGFCGIGGLVVLNCIPG